MEEENYFILTEYMFGIIVNTNHSLRTIVNWLYRNESELMKELNRLRFLAYGRN